MVANICTWASFRRSPALRGPERKDAMNTSATIIQREGLSMSEAAQVAGIGRSTLYLLVADGRLPARKCGSRTIILRSELQACLQALPKTAEPAANSARSRRGVSALESGRHGHAD